jgi:hypothetical protein
VPRAKYTKPPGPFPAIEQIQRSTFRFRKDQWCKLTELLPCKLASLRLPTDAATLPTKEKTIADRLIQSTEELINFYLTTSRLNSEASTPTNPASVRVAIRRLRDALKPFERGWVDDETASLVPADLIAKLSARYQEIANLNLPSAKRRALETLCQGIAVFVRRYATENGEAISEKNMLRYVDAALNFANIKHPNIAKHRDRLAALVFPK